MAERMVQKALRAMVPGSFILIANLIPFFFPPDLHFFLPDLGVGALYFWAVYCPERISLWAIFGSGLLLDGFFGTSFGIFGCLYLLIWAFVYMHRKYLFKKTFLTGWFGFSILYLITVILKGCIIWIVQRPFYIQDILYESAITFLSYPLIASLCFRVYQTVSRIHEKI